MLGERRLRVILCEPYHTGSHRSWAEGLARHSAHDIRLVTHTGGFWKWRMQGAAPTLAAEITELASSWGTPDVLLVSDMVHLPTLMGFARDALAGVPVVLYLHENQLTYPLPENASPDHTYAMINWLSMAAADRVVFNSDYHRRDVLARLPAFLRQFPDHRHVDLVPQVAARSSVLPVGIDFDRFAGDREVAEPPTVLWNHRWEYDKDPAVFFAALDQLELEGCDFGLIVAGESFQTVPDEFARARRRFAGRLVHFGTAPPADYPALLRRADVVLSTARHEFFGLAVLEAMAAGAFPLLPDRLSYPELLPHPSDRYLYCDGADSVDRLRWALTCHDERRAGAAAAQAHARAFDWAAVAPRYDALLADVASGGRPPPGRA